MFASIAVWVTFSASTAVLCTDHVIVEGDPTLAEGVAAELKARGIRLQPPKSGPESDAESLRADTPADQDGCLPIRARVKERSPGVELEIDSRSGPPVLRHAPDVASASTIVESWVRSDISAPLLAGFPRPRPRPIRPVEIPSRRAAPAKPPPRARPLALTLGAVVGVGNDGSTWSGADLMGCFRLSVICLGGRIQFVTDLATSGLAARLGGARSALDVGLVADVPLGGKSFELSPGIGIGTSIVQASAQGIEDETGGLRLRAQLGLAWLLTEQFELRVTSAVDYAPFANEQLLESATEDGPENIPIPGEPRMLGWLRVGLGLRGM